MKLGKIGFLLAALGALVCLTASAASAEELYRSELTGEWISAGLKDQRPVAILVDNESIALPHFGTSQSDVVYELMNSTANGRISRLMCLVKDWGTITQFGSIRSVRSSNIPLAGEWNAVLVHDGGPFYVDEYFAKPYAREHLSGGFSRVNNGKPVEFTEYVMTGEIGSRLAAAGYSATYNEYRNSDESHFNFAEDGQSVSLPKVYGDGARIAMQLSLPFYHNGTFLRYDAQKGVYDYYEYGQVYIDALTGTTMSFKNVILQDVGFHELDGNGYMLYDLMGEGQPAWYLTDGYAIPITWTKNEETDITRYYDAAGNEIVINSGKTYIALIPADSWGEVAFIN